MTDKNPVEITAAKGRPMLSWVGKRPLSRITPFPAQHIETFDATGNAVSTAETPDLWADWPGRYPHGGLLFHGDNKEVLAHLLASGFRGKVDLIYIDPPFDSGADYVRRVRLRGATGTAKLDAEGYTLGEQIQYEDIWANDNYLQFMYERLLLLYELLTERGTLYLHSDWHKNQHLRCLLDEVFGLQACLSEIVWSSESVSGFKSQANKWIRSHDTIYQYVKDRSDYTFNKEFLAVFSEATVRRYDKTDEDGRRYKIYYEGSVERRQYLDESEGLPIADVWTDIPSIQTANAGSQYTGFPTQKPEDLIARIVQASSNPGDIVLDCFIGSGTTAAVAQKLGRRWIGCDINRGAIQTSAKRLHTIVQEQTASGADNGQPTLVEAEDAPPDPAQLSFTVWRVNDYDLQIQHNEAVNLACEHIGVQRSHTDSFFDGVLGRSLVKIIPFNHPLSPLDLDEVRKELDARPEEDRAITVVCLGRELAIEQWIEDWNRMHSAANSIQVIELRTDPKYGKFFEHKPASAKVNITHEDDQITVAIQDFVSPTIIERLAAESGVLQPHIEDWRAMVDSVMLDVAYDGSVFNVCLSDTPEKKEDLVQGTYTLPAHGPRSMVAVKIIDMLGEEVLITEDLPAE